MNEEFIGAGFGEIPLDVEGGNGRQKMGQGDDPGASRNILPQLIVNGSDPTATAKDLAALIAKRDDFLFNGHAPVRIAAEADCMPRALEVTTEMVRVLAHEICLPVEPRRTKTGGVVYVPVPLSNDIAKLYLHGLEGRWGLKPFRGITTAPILSDDGTIRTASGYDARSGLWCHNIPDISLPTKPTKDDARQALRLLRDCFCTFPFADAARLYDPDLAGEFVDPTQGVGLDESSFLAALLTAVCRQSLELAPGFLCDAPNLSGAGTGKGLLVKAMCVIAGGVRPSAFTSGHNAEEFDKRLTSVLIEARPAAFLDNYNSKSLTSDTLASALTESPAMVRPMGQSKNVPLHTSTFIGIAGNAVQIAEDMARRLLNTHLDARMENPEQRKFPPAFSTPSSPSAQRCSPPRSPSGAGAAKLNSTPESPSAPMSCGHNGVATHCSTSECATRSTASPRSRPPTRNAGHSSLSSINGGLATATYWSRHKTSTTKSSTSSQAPSPAPAPSAGRESPASSQ